MAFAALLASVLAGVSVAAKAGTADLAISKGDSPDPVGVGAALTYTIGVQNLGPESAGKVTVTDQLPKGVDFVSATPSVGKCAHKSRNVSCDLGPLSAAAVSYSPPPTVTLVVIPRRAGVISNTATVKGDIKDPVAVNNKATAATTVVGPPATCRGVPASITGTAGNDLIVGTSGRDVIATLGGSDTIVALGGRDLVCAGRGDDYIGAGTAADRVFGGAGKDRLVGRGGPDVLRGGPGGDVLKGGRGADRLRGGPGVDRCRGAAGADSIRSCER
ncbi:MAG TPA: hypothetical protein VKH20_01240 [Solirubrobacterales bacterium]|nr:hypothetical protein [Solirubrobacterales bacterium]